MRRLIVLLVALGALAVPAIAGGQSVARVRTCSVQHWHGDGRWLRGTARNPADESISATAYPYDSDSCHPIALERWVQITNLAFEHYPHNGSFSGPGITGTWTHTRTVEVPDTCGGDGGAPMSTPYAFYYVRVFDLDGHLIDTATSKLRVAC